MFKVRTTAPSSDNPYYKRGVPSEGQCTWGAFYRCYEALGIYPCYHDRPTKSGSYTNAKLWLENYREPMQVKGADFKPSAGDIAVFDGEFGHVVFIEQVSGNLCQISDWNRVAPLTYASDTWEYGTRLKGCGDLLGYLHYPYETMSPVDRNPNVNQIQTTDDTLRIRDIPSLSGNIISHVQIGYYNVLQQKEADGYTWYEIAEDRWCANITTVYLPVEEEDFVNQIKRWADSLIANTKAKDEKIDAMEKGYRDIDVVVKRFIT